MGLSRARRKTGRRGKRVSFLLQPQPIIPNLPKLAHNALISDFRPSSSPDPETQDRRLRTSANPQPAPSAATLFPGSRSPSSYPPYWRKGPDEEEERKPRSRQYFAERRGPPFKSRLAAFRVATVLAPRNSVCPSDSSNPCDPPHHFQDVHAYIH